MPLLIFYQKIAMKKLLFALGISVLCLTVFTDNAYAQRRADYQTSAGLRLSGWYGVSIKHFFQGTSAIEGIVHSRWDGIKITGLYEKHMPAFDEPGLKFYYGGGAHLGFVGSTYIYHRDINYYNRYDGGSQGLFGIDGIVGVEYTIQEIDVPLNISLDWKPTVDFAPWARFGGAELGLTVRYIFGR